LAVHPCPDRRDICTYACIACFCAAPPSHELRASRASRARQEMNLINERCQPESPGIGKIATHRAYRAEEQGHRNGVLPESDYDEQGEHGMHGKSTTRRWCVECSDKPTVITKQEGDNDPTTTTTTTPAAATKADGATATTPTSNLPCRLSQHLPLYFALHPAYTPVGIIISHPAPDTTRYHCRLHRERSTVHLASFNPYTTPFPTHRYRSYRIILYSYS
jgi:hypothetical protein